MPIAATAAAMRSVTSTRCRDSRARLLVSGESSGAAVAASRRDLAELGVHAGRGHHGDGAPARHRGALVQHRGPVADRSVRGNGRRRLLNRHRLDGERRLVDGKIGGGHQARIGGGHVAGLDQHDVAGHQVLGVHHQHPAAAAHALQVRADPAQRLHGTLGLELGDEADQRVEPQHDQNGDGFLPVAERGRRTRPPARRPRPTAPPPSSAAGATGCRPRTWPFARREHCARTRPDARALARRRGRLRARPQARPGSPLPAGHAEGPERARQLRCALLCRRLVPPQVARALSSHESWACPSSTRAHGDRVASILGGWLHRGDNARRDIDQPQRRAPRPVPVD